MKKINFIITLCVIVFFSCKKDDAETVTIVNTWITTMHSTPDCTVNYPDIYSLTPCTTSSSDTCVYNTFLFNADGTAVNTVIYTDYGMVDTVSQSGTYTDDGSNLQICITGNPCDDYTYVITGNDIELMFTEPNGCVNVINAVKL